MDDITAAMSGTFVTVEVLDRRQDRLLDGVVEEREGFSSREPSGLSSLA